MTPQIELQFTTLFRETKRLRSEKNRAVQDGDHSLSGTLNIYVQGMYRAIGVLAELEKVPAFEIEALEKKVDAE